MRCGVFGITLFVTLTATGAASDFSWAVEGGRPALAPQTKAIFKGLFSFGLAEGTTPLTSLTFANGTFYGTTAYGGAANAGTVFSVDASGAQRVIYSFGGAGEEGVYPSSLTYVNGALYGTTSGGGAYGYGTVFKVTPAGVESVIYSFRGGPDGASPAGGLVELNGMLYGTTQEAGASSNGSDGGTIFEITTAGAERVLHRFSGRADGEAPQGQLLVLGGTLYGTTMYGGPSDAGTVFAVTPSGAERVIYSFKGYPTDGAFPQAGLTALGGRLYGTTEFGGKGPLFGIVFEVSTSGAERVLHYFTGGLDGSYPAAGLVAADGVLYGTTFEGGGNGCEHIVVEGIEPVGCGVVFTVTPSGAERVRYRFKGGQDGSTPQAALVEVGDELYGTTGSGGPSGDGTVFATSRAGDEHVLHAFDGDPDGAAPEASLTALGGALYGTTYGGGKSYLGTVFVATGAGRERALYSFNAGTSDGAFPISNLLAYGGALYGTTQYGGAYHSSTPGGCNSTFGLAGCGTVFEVTTAGTERVLHSFGNGDDGADPQAGLAALGSTLYGTTAYGGNGGSYCFIGCGTIFAITPAGAERVIYNFTGLADGNWPDAGLTVLGGELYGSTDGGTGGNGAVFGVSPSGRLRLIHSFAGGADGAGPSGLIAVNGVLYGTTASGGAYHYGTVFSLTTAGVHRVIYNFAGEGYGLAPQALTSLHGTLYGTTTYGGSGPCATNGHKGCGTVFAVTLAGSESVIHEFRGGADGAYPEAGLTAVGGTLYGTTSQGGLGLAPGPGTIFEITFGK